MRLVVPLLLLLCCRLPISALVVCLILWWQGFEMRHTLLLARLRGANTARASFDSCSRDSSSTSGRSGVAGGLVAVLSAAAYHHNAFHASLAGQCVGDWFGAGVASTAHVCVRVVFSECAASEGAREGGRRGLPVCSQGL